MKTWTMMAERPLAARPASWTTLALVCLWLLFTGAAHAQGDIFGGKKTVDVEAVFKEGLKKRGTVLDLAGKKIGDEGLKKLLASPLAAKVKQLDLRYNEISPEGAKALAAAPPLPELTVLILRHNFFADEGTVAFAKTSSFPNLKILELGWNEIRDAGALALGESQAFPKLGKLDLRGNFLAGTTKDALRKSLGHLKSLKLY